MPGTAFLGPVFTGAKTGSVYQASLSYTTGQVFDEIKRIDVFSTSNNFFSDKSFIDQNPVIQSSYKVEEVVFSKVLEPEPLP